MNELIPAQTYTTHQLETIADFWQQVENAWNNATDAERAAAIERSAERAARIEERLAKHETLGALLDTAAVMDPIPAYLQAAITETETEIAALEALPA